MFRECVSITQPRRGDTVWTFRAKPCRRPSRMKHHINDPRVPPLRGSPIRIVPHSQVRPFRAALLAYRAAGPPRRFRHQIPRRPSVPTNHCPQRATYIRISIKCAAIFFVALPFARPLPGGSMPAFLNVRIHFIWSTAGREPRILPEWRDNLHAYIGGICHNHNARLLAAGGIADHIHLWRMSRYPPRSPSPKPSTFSNPTPPAGSTKTTIPPSDGKPNTPPSPSQNPRRRPYARTSGIRKRTTRRNPTARS